MLAGLGRVVVRAAAGRCQGLRAARVRTPCRARVIQRRAALGGGVIMCDGGTRSSAAGIGLARLTYGCSTAPRVRLGSPVMSLWLVSPVSRRARVSCTALAPALWRSVRNISPFNVRSVAGLSMPFLVGRGCAEEDCRRPVSNGVNRDQVENRVPWVAPVFVV